QHRYAPVTAKAATDPTWQVPICVRVDGETQPRCTLLVQKTGELALGTKCPAWIEPNVDGVGYYLPKLSPELVGKLATDGWKQPPRVERIALADDLNLMVDGGHADLATVLEMMPRLAASEDPYLVDQVAWRLAGLSRLVGDAQRDAYAKLVRDL